mgnify:FL=1
MGGHVQDRDGDAGQVDDNWTELLVVGAGPHSLALAAKLLEPERDKWAEDIKNGNMFKVQRSRTDPGVVRVSAKVREKGFQRGKQAILKRMFSRAPKVRPTSKMPAPS